MLAIFLLFAACLANMQVTATSATDGDSARD
jgi:hypothetical protein